MVRAVCILKNNKTGIVFSFRGSDATNHYVMVELKFYFHFNTFGKELGACKCSPPPILMIDGVNGLTP